MQAVVAGGGKAKIAIVVLVLAVLGSLGFAFTRGGDDTGERKASAAAAECRTEADDLKEKVTKLRAALTAALDKPQTLKLSDPELLRLMGKAPPAKAAAPRDGYLSQSAVVAVVKANRGQFQTCYERALKRSTELRGLNVTMTLAFAVRGDGSVGEIGIGPKVDEGMIACMRGAVTRWRFPAFGGNPVRVEIPVPLVPKE